MIAVSGSCTASFNSGPPRKLKTIISTEEKVEIILRYYTKIPAKLFRPYHSLDTGEEFVYSIKKDLAGKYDKAKRKQRDIHPTDMQYCWLLDVYVPGDYSGAGERIGIRDDGKLVYGYTSHCSCDGPWNDEPRETKVKTVKATSKLTEVKHASLDGLDWGPSYIENVDTLWAVMVEENPWIVPYE